MRSSDESSSRDLVCVLETDPTGHRLRYVRHLVTATGPDRCVLLTTREAVESNEYATHLRPAGTRFVTLPQAASRREVLDSALRWATAASARLLVVPDGDKYVVPLLRRRPVLRRTRPEIRLLMMRTATIGGPEGLRPTTAVKPLLVQMLRRLPGVRVLFLTDAMGVIERRRGYPGLPPVRDPVPRSEADAPRRPEWLPPEGADTVVGLFGVVSARKNLPLLVQAVAELPHVVLVVAGHLAPNVRRFVETDPTAVSLCAEDRMRLVDRFLDPDEYGAGLSAVDVVALLHDNDAPSGVLGEACTRGTPVLVPQGGWLERVVEATGVGAAVPMTVAGVCAGMTRIMEDRWEYVEAARAWSATVGTDDFRNRLLGP
ncbi:hypothetical protein GCM10010472_34240 [Pseudonocardia halophobica]|uniref:Uncharacterized protein n=1 Tax=Pseudonocardia halophobica TaxID=29401 RepID=A0A9W6L2X0_9PSEU|nr:hypothetical protein GCM10017577_32040 [Pseudonocardia halophobica]